MSSSLRTNDSQENFKKKKKHPISLFLLVSFILNNDYLLQPNHPERALSHLNNDHFPPTLSEITYCQTHMHVNLEQLVYDTRYHCKGSTGKKEEKSWEMGKTW